MPGHQPFYGPVTCASQDLAAVAMADASPWMAALAPRRAPRATPSSELRLFVYAFLPAWMALSAATRSAFIFVTGAAMHRGTASFCTTVDTMATWLSSPIIASSQLDVSAP